MPAQQPRPNLVSTNERVDNHERRIGDLEQREAKYDVILERLSTIVEFLTQRIENVAARAENAIDGQGVAKERNEGAHRWATIGIALGSSAIVGIIMFIVGYVVRP